jgi:cob(I)alamin adenosyltransferase
MTRFYTTQGDDGYTGLLGEGRIPKYDLRTEAIGGIDEATAFLGLARAQCKSPNSNSIILSIQRDLYRIMAEVASSPENAATFRTISASHVEWLEKQTDELALNANMPNEFIIPGDSLPGAALDVARTVVRRAERRVAQLLHLKELENAELLRYLNRLSSLCFVLELIENQFQGQEKPTLAKGNS